MSRAARGLPPGVLGACAYRLSICCSTAAATAGRAVLAHRFQPVPLLHTSTVSVYRNALAVLIVPCSASKRKQRYDQTHADDPRLTRQHLNRIPR